MDDTATLWCPSCGAEYRPGATICPDCRVALAGAPPSHFGEALQPQASEENADEDEESYVELGEYPRVNAQILRSRLEAADVPVMIEWVRTPGNTTGILIVPEDKAEFAAAVVNEIDVDDEVPDTSPYAYLTRIEEHMAAATGLLEELRSRLDEMEAGGTSLSGG
jgi:hypothetical protein